MRPIIGVSASRVTNEDVDYDAARCRYLSAAYELAEGLPVILPNFVRDDEAAANVLQILDGLILAGDRPEAAAERSGAVPRANGTRLDPARDLTAPSLLPSALEAGIPILAIGRGLHELNLYLGGDLHEDLAAEGGFLRHHEDETPARDGRHHPRHDLHVTGGLLREIAGSDAITVNSLHRRGLRTVAPGLQVQGKAPDGLVEAVSVLDATAFALGVQWHPEWCAHGDEVSRSIFRAFGAACRKHRFRSRERIEPLGPLPRYLKVR
ncbi:MAG TPA: gamma-glutamyl-gamma-aminobutyrate hydrolase family protein [Stellaceae bacterium]|nr:gamma-glutamyl-gamma-aminobutyrate hydrolase family protein [Stellaceae bacterium]